MNINAGDLPEPAGNNVRYLKIPINLFRPEGETPVQLIEACAPNAESATSIA